MEFKLIIHPKKCFTHFFYDKYIAKTLSWVSFSFLWFSLEYINRVKAYKVIQ